MKTIENLICKVFVILLFVSVFVAAYATYRYVDMVNEAADLESKLADTMLQANDWKDKAMNSKNIIVRVNKVSFDDFYLLARLIESEAGGESFETKMMVASVVMNRVSDSRFPDSIHGVIYQKGQFDVTVATVGGQTMIEKEPSLDSLRAANDVLNEGSILPSNVLVFYMQGVDDEWVTSRTTYNVSDDTVFAFMD